MRVKQVLIFFISMFFGLWLYAQETTGINADIRAMSKETDPAKVVSMMKAIIEAYKLDEKKDAETLDILNGTVAVAFAMKQDHAEFEKYVALIRNKFNQTSILNMAASRLLNQNLDVEYALRISKQTIDSYLSYRNDPGARPENYNMADWNRFMDFAQYPYYDTYAHALFVAKKYNEALIYQKKAFMGPPEEGMPSSIERYAKLLELTGDLPGAKQLLIRVAGLGKLNKNMMGHLKSLYLSQHGREDHFNAYLDSLQAHAKEDVAKELSASMLDVAAPGFTLKDLQGKAVRLSDYKGKIVVLDLWATWCVPCIASFPAMQTMVKKHPEVAFLFIAVNEEGDKATARVKKFIKKNKYDFLVLMDEPVETGSDVYKITSAYRPDGIPTKYIIDKNGIMRFTSSGFDTDSQLINELEAMFKVLEKL